MAATKVAAVMCLDCKRLSTRNPTEMEHIKTTEAAEFSDALVSVFRCGNCGRTVGVVHRPVKIMKDGREVLISHEEFER